jgi:TRAP transporter TAXI family solute receptor
MKMKLWKKGLAFGGVFLLSSTLLIYGIPSTPEAGAADQNIHIIMGPMGGTMYPIGALMGEIFSKNIPGVRSNVSPGGSITNIVACDSNKAQIGHTTSEMAFAALQGKEPFKKAHKDFRGMFKFMNMGVQFVIANDSPVHTLAEVKAKKYPLKLAVNPPGNVAELMIRKMLDLYGMSYDTIKEWGGKVNFASHADMSSLYRDRHIEAMLLYTSIPAPAFVEADLTRPLSLIKMDDKLIGFLKNTYGLEPLVVAKGTYKGMKEDTTLLTGGILIVCNRNLPDELVYKMMKLLFAPENLRRLTGMHKHIEAYLTSVNKAAQGMSIPFHPGAERFFKEVGAIK